MDLVFCELCFAPVHSGEQHRCFFLRSDEDIYTIPNPNESEEKGTTKAMLEEVNSGNNNDGSVTIYSNFGEKKVYADLEVFSQAAKNNEQIPLSGSTRKTKYPAYFAGDINNTWSLSSCDNSLLDSNMIIQECTLNTRENKSAPKSSFGSENTFASPTTLASTGFLMCQKNWDEFEAPKNLLDTSIATRADTGSLSSNLNAKLDLKQSQEFMKNAAAVAGVSAIRPRLKNPAKKRKRDSDLCPPKLKNEADLVSHEGKRARQKRFECNICEKRFSYKSQLDTHRRTHTGEKPYGCDYCDRRFNRKSHLKNHLWTHTGEKPYGCNYCDRRFNRKSQLENHLRTHTGEKPYKCEYCESRFSQKATLDNHRRLHTGEKPFKCEICKKDFVLRSSLRRHAAEVHIQERPFKCGACGKAFKSDRARNKHRKKMH